MSNQTPKIAVIIPALDEADTIARVITGIRDNTRAKIVVIDDASTDDTIQQARRAGAMVLPLTVRLGAWGAIRTGMRYVAQHNHVDIVVTMDADGQHDPAFIPHLIDPVLTDQADMVIGSCVSRGSIFRKITWAFFRRFNGFDLMDLTSGYRAYSRATLDAVMSLDTALLDYQDIGVLLALRKAGLRILEVPVGMCPRIKGHSRVFHTWWDVFIYLTVTTILCVSKVKIPKLSLNRR